MRKLRTFSCGCSIVTVDNDITKPCLKCFHKERDRITEEQEATLGELPVLVGSAGQVNWARSIRAKILISLIDCTPKHYKYVTKLRTTKNPQDVINLRRVRPSRSPQKPKIVKE